MSPVGKAGQKVIRAGADLHGIGKIIGAARVGGGGAFFVDRTGRKADPGVEDHVVFLAVEKPVEAGQPDIADPP